MKQYHATMAQLRFWRRNLDESNDDDNDDDDNYRLLQGKIFNDRICLIESTDSISSSRKRNRRRVELIQFDSNR
jgi:hypothetical protein